MRSASAVVSTSPSMTPMLSRPCSRSIVRSSRGVLPADGELFVAVTTICAVRHIVDQQMRTCQHRIEADQHLEAETQRICDDAASFANFEPHALDTCRVAFGCLRLNSLDDTLGDREFMHGQPRSKYLPPGLHRAHLQIA